MNSSQFDIIEEEEFEGEETLGQEYKDNLLTDTATASNDDTDIYPDATINIISESASVFQLKRKYDKKPPQLILDPDFQRKGLWSDKQKSELIESILMGIPLPLIYVKEDNRGVYIIVDGRQRLTTLFEFLNHDFPLTKLTVLRELNGSYFSDESKSGDLFPKHLTHLQQNKIEDCSLNLHVIKPPTPDRVTFDLFDRVNRGGTRLNNQEMRNAIYQGPATKLLNKLVAFESFTKATEYSIHSTRMKDRYLVLRLIGFYLWRTQRLIDVKEAGQPLVSYRSDLEDFLGKTMLFLNDESGGSFRDSFPSKFDRVLTLCFSHLGKGCFRLPKKGNGPRRPISMALFESVCYLVLQMIDSDVEVSRALLMNAYKYLSSSEEFLRSTTYIVDSNKSVYGRFDLVDQVVEDMCVRHSRC